MRNLYLVLNITQLFYQPTNYISPKTAIHLNKLTLLINLIFVKMLSLNLCVKFDRNTKVENSIFIHNR